MMLTTRTEKPRSVVRRAGEAIRLGPISATVLSALLVGVGCGPSGGSSGETGDSGTGSGTSGTTGESETGTSIDCASFIDETDCLAAGCAGLVGALRFLDAADCDSPVSSEVCVPPGPVWDGVPTAYHRMVDGARVFVSIEPCDADDGPVVVPGEGWSECSGGAEDPDECACLCAHGTCAGEWQRDAMVACNLPEPCAAFEINGGGAEWENAAVCVLDAASTAASAHLTITGDWGDPYEASHVFLLGDGTALWNRYAGDHSCFGCGCGQGFAPSLDLCTLEAPSVFAACEASLSPEPDGCLSPTRWFSWCAPAEPACGP